MVLTINASIDLDEHDAGAAELVNVLAKIAIALTSLRSPSAEELLLLGRVESRMKRLAKRLAKVDDQNPAVQWTSTGSVSN